MLRFFFSILFLIALFTYTRKLFSNNGNLIHRYVLAVFWCNIIVFVLTGAVCSRYHIISVIPCLMLVAYWGMDMQKKIKSVAQKQLFSCALFCLFIGIMFASDYAVVKDECYPATKTENIKTNLLCQYLHEYKENQIFFLNDTGLAEVLRTLDYGNGKEYLSFMTETGTVVVHDYYLSRTDAAGFEADHLLVLDENKYTLENLPVYMQNLYKQVGKMQNYIVYQAKVNRMDGVSGYPLDRNLESTKDYCFSPGYVIYQGELDLEGNLYVHGNGDYVLAGPLMEKMQANLKIQMNYSTAKAYNSETVWGVMEVWDADTHEMITQENIRTTENKCVIKDVDTEGRNVVLKVKATDGTEIKIKNFEYMWWH